MNIDRLIATIPTLGGPARSEMRANAMAKQASGDPKWATAALAILAALDAQEAAEADDRREARAVRMAGLQSGTNVERVIAAFEDLPPTPTEEKLIQVLLDHPNSSCADLSTAMGWDPVAWDMHFGMMCSKRLEWLWPLEPSVREEKDGYIRLLTVQQKIDEQPIRYEMRPEAIAAFAHLNIVRKK